MRSAPGAIAELAAACTQAGEAKRSHVIRSVHASLNRSDAENRQDITRPKQDTTAVSTKQKIIPIGDTCGYIIHIHEADDDKPTGYTDAAVICLDERTEENQAPLSTSCSANGSMDVIRQMLERIEFDLHGNRMSNAALAHLPGHISTQGTNTASVSAPTDAEHCTLSAEYHMRDNTFSYADDRTQRGDGIESQCLLLHEACHQQKHDILLPLSRRMTAQRNRLLQALSLTSPSANGRRQPPAHRAGPK